MASLALLKSHPHKPSHSLLKSTIFSHHYSSSSSSNNNNDNFSSYFNDIKSKLKQQQPSQSSNFANQSSPTSDYGGRRGGDDGDNTPVKHYPFSSSLTDIKSKLKQHQNQQQSKPTTSNDEIRRNLHEFRLRASGSGSFPTNLGSGGERTEAISFQAIKDSLNQLMSAGDKGKNRINSMSFNSNFKAQPTMPDRGNVGNVIGGSGLPMGVFGKEMKDKEMKKGEGDSDETEMWLRPYSIDELGKKLRELRPEGKGNKGGEEKGFSLSELNERLKKVKENEDKETSKTAIPYSELRRSLRTMQIEAKSSTKFVPIQGFDILGSGTPNFMLSPPKEHLVEKYFHPDNMSSEEKLKLELKKVRDAFKMHESDCGSARVQIAQLTTEILHLSSVLHKKDKHSRRGLQAKVQQRKKLLKYLRRTDWDSYCFVLSKLGLRDNPDYKN